MVKGRHGRKDLPFNVRVRLNRVHIDYLEGLASIRETDVSDALRASLDAIILLEKIGLWEALNKLGGLEKLQSYKISAKLNRGESPGSPERS